MLANRGFNLCLQVEKNSLLSLRVAPSGLNIIKYFSFRHRLHRLVEGLKLWLRVIIFHEMLYCVFFQLPNVVAQAGSFCILIVKIMGMFI